MKARIFKAFLVVLCLVSFSISPARAQNEITIIDLGTLGGPESIPFGLNDLGQVVGQSYGDAFLWNSKTGMQDLSQILGISGQAIYINNQGQVVGNNPTFLWSPSDGYTRLTNTQSYPGGVNNLGQVVGKFNVIVGAEIEQTHAFLWSKGTGLQDLGTLAGNTWNSEAMAVGINDHGQVVGWSDTPATGPHAFRWTPETGMQDLGLIVDYQTSELFINNNGEIAGSRYIDTSHRHGFLWTPEKGLLDLGTLSSLPNSESRVSGFNDQGQVIGKSDTISGYTHAFLWTEKDGMVDLGTLGGNYSSAIDINNLGQIVGVSNLPSGERHAFLWTEKDGMIDLGTLEGGNSAAYEINNSGQIVGISDKFYGGDPGFMRAVLWQLPASVGPFPTTPTFADVPLSHPYWQDIEILYANGLTGGCATSPLKFCPDQIMNRGQAAVFMLRANFGSSYVPPTPIHYFKDDWKKGPWAETWAEGMRNTGLSAGCSTNPPKYCPWAQIPREQAVIFALRMKYGASYTPPPATGTLFADMTNKSYYATSWAEQAYQDELIPNCGISGGKPKFCPKDLVSRGLAAYMIVRAKDLTMP
jgi:probable HAF family extracellular repeat protein